MFDATEMCNDFLALVAVRWS